MVASYETVQKQQRHWNSTSLLAQTSRRSRLQLRWPSLLLCRLCHHRVGGAMGPQPGVGVLGQHMWISSVRDAMQALQQVRRWSKCSAAFFCLLGVITFEQRQCTSRLPFDTPNLDRHFKCVWPVLVNFLGCPPRHVVKTIALVLLNNLLVSKPE